MNILLFGGAFNPPHLGHLLVIEQAFELIPNIDELWLLPSYGSTFGKEMAEPHYRIEMLKLMLRQLNRALKVRICTIEKDNKLRGSTYETLHVMKSESDYADNSYSFLMGSDQIERFDEWDYHQELLDEMQFYVYPRAGYPHRNTYPQMKYLDSPTQVITNLSSTLVRKRLKKGLDLQWMVLPSVLNYIKDNKLYA